MRRLLVTMALAAVASACASSGAVPRPFPMAGSPPRPPIESPPGAAAPGDAASDNLPPSGPLASAPLPDRPPILGPALVATALRFRGVPYRNGGTDPAGFDCSGFTQYVFSRYGITLPREVREQFTVGQAITSGEVSAGDLLFFATTDPGASHVGIAIDRFAFVHAPSSTGVVRVERLSATYWLPRFLGARRVTQP